MTWLLLALIEAYRRLISPLLGGCCRFYPTCSCYAYTAIAKHGAARGGRLALLRILKCHGYHPGGWDPPT